MWRSGKKPPKPRKSNLPPSQRLLLWAKGDRIVERTQFHGLRKEWDSVSRRPVEPDVVAVKAADPSLPAWMSYRTKVKKAAPIYFRTKPIDRKKPT